MACNNFDLKDDFESSGMQEECGVFGCVGGGMWPSLLGVSKIIQLGLVGLQHRGQESAGIVVGDGGDDYVSKKGIGLVGSIFNEDDLLKLQGNLGIGHTRYSTMGGTDTINVQPFVVETIHGKIAVAHNGELVNAKSLRKRVLMHGVGLSCSSDSELITQVLTLPPDDGEPDGANWVARIQKMMALTPTSYSLVILRGDRIYAVRDPFGNRPLCLGVLLQPEFIMAGSGILDNLEHIRAEGFVVSSESCPFTSIGARYYREVLPGEIVELSRTGIKSCAVVPRPDNKPPAFCIFEYVYFARADSIFETQQVYTARKNCGHQLAIESPVDADIVSTVPESATPSAMEYARVLGLPYLEVLCKNRYEGRTFIQPTNRLRQLAVSKKFGVLTDNIKGKRLILIDDSIVRGNTMRSIVKLLKICGAKEVHIRIASPPITNCCYMGINIPTVDELIGAKMNVKEIGEYILADSLHYLSVEGLVKAIREGIKEDGSGREYGHCVACLTGQYPTALDW